MAVEILAHEGGKNLAQVLTKDNPLGPSDTEGLIHTTRGVFERLYDGTNHIHQVTQTTDPSYIAGRKGSGKTAFLLGGALAGDPDIVLLRSNDLFVEINKLRRQYAVENGPLPVDSLVNVWETVLLHAAMWAISCSDRVPHSEHRLNVWRYMTSFGDPTALEADQLLARVTARLADAILGAPPWMSFREKCEAIEGGPGHGPLASAVASMRTIIEEAGSDSIYVVIDNLEDLHRHLTEFQDVVSGLLRVTSRAATVNPEQRLPFKTRFAFPAELLPRLRLLAANAEKDFLNYVRIRWTASELIVIAGNRLRYFLDIHSPETVLALGLPRLHDTSDRDAAEATLRAVLPAGEVANGLGSLEDPVAYIMRHTQLLPRQLIQILNEVLRPAVKRTPQRSPVRVDASDIYNGIREAERRIVENILGIHHFQYPHVAQALSQIKNHVSIVERASSLHRKFNNAGARRSGMEFEDFLQACVAIGALGIVNEEESTERYVVGEFSYTFTDDLRPVEARDSVCVHPLFMYQWFDSREIPRLAGDGVKPVYPYGSDPRHTDVEF